MRAAGMTSRKISYRNIDQYEPFESLMKQALCLWEVNDKAINKIPSLSVLSSRLLSKIVKVRIYKTIWV
jgi:hypothetical protein